MKKSLNVFIGLFFALALFLTMASNVKAENCNGDICATIMSAGGHGSLATASITNKGTASARVSFSAYKLFVQPGQTGWLDTQVLYDSKTITLSAGQTQQVSINTAECMNQVDVYKGEVISKLYDSNGHGEVLVVFAYTNDPLCSSCTDECSDDDQRECSGNGWKQCGNYDSDSCKEWSTITQCGWNQTCVNGSCIGACQNECALGRHECSGSLGRTCVQSGQCTVWESWQTCDAQCYRCGDDSCECGETQSSCPQDCGYNTPTVDLRSSGSVTCNKNATLTWTSTNATSCSASGSWSGSKLTSGSESVGDFTGSRTFILTCYNGNASAFDSVTLDGNDDPLEVNAGSDKDVDGDESVRLDGSVDGDYDSLSWHCTGGSLSDYNILRPTFRPPFNYDSDYDYDRTYTCILTARNECGSDSDSVRIDVEHQTTDFNVALTARPKSDCAPLYDVDLTATISNYGSDSYNRNYTYYFDCENDGSWDKTITTSNTSYTATNLCDYRNVGSYTARVRVEQGNRTATDTEIVRAEQCGQTQTGNVSITKTVSNVSRGTGYQGTVTANPLDIVSYKIIVGGVSGNSENVRVSDAVPAGITNIRDLQVDGYAASGNSLNDINLGSFFAGQTKIITYTATIADESNFIYGQTTLNNVATVYAGNNSANSNASVYVYRRGIQGATTISTGFDGNMMIGLGIAFAGIILCLGWLFRKRIAGFFKNDPRKALREKIAFVKENGLAR